MTDAPRPILETVLCHLDRVPVDAPVALLLRHTTREHMAPGDDGRDLPVTEAGRALAVQLGRHLRGRLRRLYSSPLARCTQTAEAVAEGAEVELAVVHDRHLGDPGAFVVDDRLAWSNWLTLGHEGVMRRLMSTGAPLPGMAHPHAAAQSLLRHMLDVSDDGSGLHLFISHDSIIAATVAQLIGRPLEVVDWPRFLEGAFFWRQGDQVLMAYRDMQASQLQQDQASVTVGPAPGPREGPTGSGQA